MARSTLVLVTVSLMCFHSSMQTKPAALVTVEMAPFSSTSDVKVDKIMKQCEELGICEDSVSYPEEFAKTLTAEVKHNAWLLDRDDDIVPDTPVLSSRLGDSSPRLVWKLSYSPHRYHSWRSAPRTRVLTSATWNPCEPISKRITPMMVRHNGTWLYVLNNKDEPLQQYDVQICNPNSSTRASQLGCGSAFILKDGYTPKCIQKFMLRSIIVMENGEAVSKLVEMPSCCTCVAVLNDNES